MDSRPPLQREQPEAVERCHAQARVDGNIEASAASTNRPSASRSSRKSATARERRSLAHACGERAPVVGSRIDRPAGPGAKATCHWLRMHPAESEPSSSASRRHPVIAAATPRAAGSSPRCSVSGVSPPGLPGVPPFIACPRSFDPDADGEPPRLSAPKIAGCAGADDSESRKRRALSSAPLPLSQLLRRLERRVGPVVRARLQRSANLRQATRRPARTPLRPRRR